MDQGDGPVFLRDGAKFAQRDRMVAAEADRDHARVKDGLKSFFYEAVGFLDIAGDHGQVTVVDARDVVKDGDLLDRIVGADHHGGVADCGRSEPLARAVASGGVERSADEGDVHVLGGLDMRKAHEGPDAAELRDFQ